MAVPGSGSPLLFSADAGAPGGFAIERSLRFNSADSAYLSRTPASAGNRKTWTWSGWVKKSKLKGAGGDYSTLFAAGTNNFVMRFDTSEALEIYDYSGGFIFNYVTSAVYRDLSAWFHVVLAVDTTNGTTGDRVKLYINGSRVTTFSAATNPSLNADGTLNTTVAHYIGRASNGIYYDGYLADVYLIDGSALDPTSFGEFDTNGVWQPIDASGLTYGTNGFHLPFSDNSSAAALGYDAAGSNDWTVNNLSVTAGAGNDSLRDSPTNGDTANDTGLGGEVPGNYCTWNPLSDLAAGATFTNGNLEVTTIASGEQSIPSTLFATSGKWYAEITVTTSNTCSVGLIPPNYSTGQQPGITADSYGYRNNGTKITNGSVTSYAASFTNGDIIGIALDLTGGTIVFYKNGVSQGTAFTGVSGTLCVAFGDLASSVSTSCIANFGQRPFAYTAPSGFKALCTANLPTPTIEDPSTVMDVALYTGNSNNATTIACGFQPDLVWIKNRTNGDLGVGDHMLFDQLRGVQNYISSNRTDAEVNNANALQEFTTNGFKPGSMARTNATGYSYAAWTWDAGSSTATNNSGSISSQVRANISAGFSVVSYTGNYSNATVGHGLGVAPQMIIVKDRTAGYNWQVYHYSIGNGNGLLLNTTDAAQPLSSWNNTSPTSSVFSLGAVLGVNNSTAHIAYCFAPVAGYSAFGSYTGNGSTDGPFVYTGFRPAVVLVKMSSSTGNWTILDDKREGYNVDNDPLYPNLSSAEGTTDLIDITSNGFKVRTTDATFNTSSGTYVYAAWASSPFAYARAR